MQHVAWNRQAVNSRKHVAFNIVDNNYTQVLSSVLCVPPLRYRLELQLQRIIAAFFIK